jgi:hypothetical protein
MGEATGNWINLCILSGEFSPWGKKAQPGKFSNLLGGQITGEPLIPLLMVEVGMADILAKIQFRECFSSLPIKIYPSDSINLPTQWVKTPGSSQILLTVRSLGLFLFLPQCPSNLKPSV